MTESNQPLKTAVQLVSDAFDSAREGGKRDWDSMTIAVLKNRILGLTSGAFKEADYGASTFREFVKLADSIVELDTLRKPAQVTLRTRPQANTDNPAATVPAQPRGRIRPDLWQATLDYSSGASYVWDVDRGIARPASADDSFKHKVPTITREKLREWQRDFLSNMPPATSPREESQLVEWQQRLSPKLLPSRLRGPWNGHLRAEVEKHLREWFAEAELSPPTDITIATQRNQEDVALDELRRVWVRHIGVMTREELLQLQLPMAAVLRLAMTRGR